MTQRDSQSQWQQRGLWAISIPLLIQTAIIIALPLQAAIATVLGTTVILRTVPVNPYDPLRGYYTTLQYDISQRGVLSTLEGWDEVQPNLEPVSAMELLRPGKSFFVVLAQSEPDPPVAEALVTPWQPIAISRQRPTNLPDNQIAIKGTYRSDRVIYGLERYYLPEAERIDLERRIREAQTGEEQPRLMVEIRIGPLGKAVPIALWLQEQRIEF
ncbi:GDYXXLXY domain-containing protein [Oscillatoria sp. CS-180]|uniref:GDYXXLXY domain-containing protein n=1 Tax=Oscillatoria sp. CS-180 TaxID=3021720 RepID=UPI00232C322C|nr:GDYXXLXY domain-containing protein [Oscillatoria sp. CS-180]MDB9528176.1 GDYXXLXY domain-containing protein [Oscillatoria sp. CS-180]